MKTYRILIFLLILLIIPSVSIAQDKDTGMILYSDLKLLDDPNVDKDVDKMLKLTSSMQYLAGFLDGIALVQELIYSIVIPPEKLSESERENLAKKINLQRINIPESGISPMQFAMIFKKWAENHPEELNKSDRICVLLSLTETYGYK
jgi:hypothetical protein